MDLSDAASDLSSLLASPTAVPDDDDSDIDDVERDGMFYFRLLVFKAGNRLFKLHRSSLPESPVFDVMFAREDGGPGSSDDNPVCLDSDVSATDFRSLLKAAYQAPGSTSASLTFSEWMSVLKLAKKWDLSGMREKATTQTDAQIQSMSAVDKIALGKEHSVDKWLKEGYRVLASQTDAISDKEKNELGLETFAQLMIVRERSFISVQDSNSGGNYYCGNCGTYHHCQRERANFDFDSAIEEIFSDEKGEKVTKISDLTPPSSTLSKNGKKKKGKKSGV